jgi:hypothetical protein
MTWLHLFIDAIAVYRLTRLVVEDGITAPIRDRIISKRDGSTRDWWEQLLTCRYCVGIYVGVGVAFARWVFPVQWTPIAYMLAIASAAPLLAGLEPD